MREAGLIFHLTKYSRCQYVTFDWFFVPSTVFMSFMLSSLSFWTSS